MIDWKPLTKPCILISFCISVSALIDAGFDHAFFSPLKTAWKTSGPPIRSNRNSSHIMFVHSDWPPSEIGAMLLALNFGTRVRMSSQVFGGSSLASSKTFLL